MEPLTFRISRVGDTPFVVPRIGVILGSNGSGKSTALKDILEQFVNTPNIQKLVSIEGGRAIKIRPNLKLTRDTFDQYQTLNLAEQTHTNKLKGTLAARVFDALIHLERRGSEIKANHSDAVHNWTERGRQGDVPTRSQLPLEVVFELFHEIFPYLKLDLNAESKDLIVRRIGTDTPYDASRISDGEKQVFSILADVFAVQEKERIFLVDEPELNLNPQLAVRLWNTIESEFPNSQFIYSTHSVSFAMRSSVEKVIVLSSTTPEATIIANISDLPSDELPALLGSIPAILSSNKVLITEGNDSSFDSLFFRWIAGIEDLSIVSVGSCTDVKSVANRHGIWEAIAAGLTLVGVVDQDFGTVDEQAAGRILALPFHEAESFLCFPDLVLQLAQDLSTVETQPSRELIQNAIVNFSNSHILSISARRLFAKSTYKIGASLAKKTLNNIITYEALELAVATNADEELRKAYHGFNPEQQKGLLKQEFDSVKTAIDERNFDEIIKLVPGKQLLNKLAPLAGCRDALAFARGAVKHLSVPDFPHLVALRSNIRQRFGVADL